MNHFILLYINYLNHFSTFHKKEGNFLDFDWNKVLDLHPILLVERLTLWFAFNY